MNPVLLTATFTLRGSDSNVGLAEDVPAGIALGAAVGDVFVTGSTTSFDFPTTPGAPQRLFGSGASDAFLSKVSFGRVAQPRPNFALNKRVFVSLDFAALFAGGFAVDGPSTGCRASSAMISGSTSIWGRPSPSGK